MKQGIYLLLGTNLGDRAVNLRRATQRLEEAVGPVAETSSCYETAAWGVTEQPAFHNQVVRIKTTLGHEALLRTLQQIERQLGKVKVAHWRERLIDLDILYYGNRVVRTPWLTLPHPQLHHRRFTLVPLSELAPQFVHPMLGKTQQELLAVCTDRLAVKWVSPDPYP
ncbi:MAG: 2-amino-4-hydroxy-6-hydroxymethyldihydropteridine diphosphokinase [Tunicatimonas sp.]